MMRTGGLSVARLGRMRETLAAYVERREVPGIVALVSRRGEVHVDAIGTKHLSGSEPIRRDTIFRIASLTKPIAAAAAMILVEECKLRLDEPVERLLPELARPRVLRSIDGPIDDTVPAMRSITVRDVLTSCMGWGVVLSPLDAPYPIETAMTELGVAPSKPRPPAPPPVDEWIRRLGTLPLMFQPGDRWMYHTSSDVLGVLIARAAGQPFETFLRERLFEPLGMTDTGFSVPAGKLDRLATSYEVDVTSGALSVYDAPETSQWSSPPRFPSGGGGLVSTIDDYFAFARMMLGKGKLESERILSRPSVEAMITDQLDPAQKVGAALIPGFFDDHGWGFGLSVVTRRRSPAQPIGKFGWDGGLGTSWRSDPSEDMVTILMTQRAWVSARPSQIAVDFATLAYQAIDD